MRLNLPIELVNTGHNTYQTVDAYYVKQCFDTLCGVVFDVNASWSTVDDIVKLGTAFHGIHLVRDPRDLLVSAYFSHKFSHSTNGWPSLATHRYRLKSLTFEDGLLLEIDFNKSVFEAMADWKLNPFILELRYESVIEAELKYIQLICDWFEWNIPYHELLAIVNAATFRVLASRNRGEEDLYSHYRKGVANDWMNYFTPAVKQVFYSLYEPLLLKWGYEP
jgi:hypothetical protein